MLRMPLSLVSPAGPRGRLSILIFHRVLPVDDPLFPDIPSARAFEERMRWVRDWFNVLPLGTAIDRLYAGTIPARALAITFDDGYADNETLAAPILASLGLVATFFVTTSYLGGGCMWNDRVIEAVRAAAGPELDLRSIGLDSYPLGDALRRRAAIDAVLTAIKHRPQAQREAAVRAIVAAADARPLPPLMMTPDQVRRLRGLGMEVGAHTVSHPILAKLDASHARAEIGDGKRELESIVGDAVPLFAYPNGVPGQDYTALHAAMVRELGFAAAVSTSWGAASRQSDRFQLPRFSPWDRTRMRYGARLLGNLGRSEKVAA